MDFKINENFAKHYNEYRQKEEFQKLKSRYGDVKIGKKVSDGKEDVMSETDSDSDTSSSSSNSELEEKEHEDFLLLYDALCRNDPSLNDSDRIWFRNHSHENESVDLDSKFEKPSNVSGRKLLLKDHTREFLLSHGGVEDEKQAEEAKTISKLDSLTKLKNAAALEQKKSFLEETEVLFDSTDGDEECLISKKINGVESSHGSKKQLIDTSHFHFNINGSEEDQRFLLDYLVNKRWKKHENISDSPQSRKIVVSSTEECADSLSKSSMKSLHKVDQETSKPSLDCIDEEDEEFLVKARRFEHRWNNNDTDLVNEYPNTSAARFRFEEDDRDFIKTYPRHIESTLRQPSHDKLTRAEKRQARKKRKEEEKKEKLDALQRLKRLKLVEFAKKLEHIRKTCGEGITLQNLTSVAQDLTADVEDQPIDDVTEAMINNLESDWDPEAHEKLVQKLFDGNYYGASNEDDNLEEPPEFSADEDGIDFSENIGLDEGKYDDFTTEHIQKPDSDFRNEIKSVDLDHSQSSAISRAAKDLHDPLQRRGKKSHACSKFRQALEKTKPLYDALKNPDFEKYFDEFYQLDCEDIISGSGPGDDIRCRFKYREVKPNDFGLTMEEILAANEKELNKWVSVKMMSVYRTDEEEEHDLRKYHSFRMQQKKPLFIPSIQCEPKNDERLQNESISVQLDVAASESNLDRENQQSNLSKKALKRLRKKERNAQFQSIAPSQLLPPDNTDHKLPIPVDKTSKSRRIDQTFSEAISDLVLRPTTKKKKRLSSDNEPMTTSFKPMQDNKIPVSEHDNVSCQPLLKKHKHKSKPKLSDDRLRAAGIDPKRFRYMKSN